MLIIPDVESQTNGAVGGVVESIAIISVSPASWSVTDVTKTILPTVSSSETVTESGRLPMVGTSFTSMMSMVMFWVSESVPSLASTVRTYDVTDS